MVSFGPLEAIFCKFCSRAAIAIAIAAVVVKASFVFFVAVDDLQRRHGCFVNQLNRIIPLFCLRKNWHSSSILSANEQFCHGVIFFSRLLEQAIFYGCSVNICLTPFTS